MWAWCHQLKSQIFSYRLELEDVVSKQAMLNRVLWHRKRMPNQVQPREGNGAWTNGIPNFCKVNTGSITIPFNRVNCRNVDCATMLSHIYSESMVGRAEAPFIAILDTRDGAQVRGLHNRNDVTIKLLNQRFGIYTRVVPIGLTGIAPRLITNELHGKLPGIENSLEAPRVF